MDGLVRFLFRVDASRRIGAGHVMRCLALADALGSSGADCRFVCRALDGNMIEHIDDRGYRVYTLQTVRELADDQSGCTNSLGTDARIDAVSTSAVVNAFAPDWLIVDHYSIDQRWEREVNRFGMKMLVIDDLANRTHLADVLIDQNLGRVSSDYEELVPEGCRVLVGPEYALLRRQFAELRPASELRRANPRYEILLVSMGGTDPFEVTGQILDLLQAADVTTWKRVQVVMGANAGGLERVRWKAARMPVKAEVLVAASNMAELMFEADFAIGAGGSTSWERCCLGLPAVLVSTADNQVAVAEHLHRAGAAIYAGGFDSSEWKNRLLNALAGAARPDTLRRMCRKALSITDGRGVSRVCETVLGTERH